MVKVVMGVIRLSYIGLVLILLSITTNAQTTRYVSATGNDELNVCNSELAPCASIQAAIDASDSGDSVLVASGEYAPFSIGFGGPEDLIIYGEEGALIILGDAIPNRRIIDLRSDGTTLSGFNISGGENGGNHVAVSVSGDSVTISNNTISGVLTGIQTTTSYTNGYNILTGNTITGSGYGISLQNNSNVITSNTITVTTEGMGIGSSSNLISGNIFTVNTDGVVLQTYSGGSLPGADVDIQNILDNNSFARAVYVTDNSGVAVETVFASIQDAINAAEAGNNILVRPGTYSEEISYSGTTFGLVIDKTISVTGVDGSDNLIIGTDNVQATLTSGAESNFGTNFYVTAADVSIQGIEFEAAAGSVDPESPSNAVNKAFEITADGFSIQHSIVKAAEGYNFDGKTSTSIYFGDEDPDDLNNFTVDSNRLHGGITITNGAGDGDEEVNFAITNNVVTGNHFLRVRGAVDDVAWLNSSAHLPTELTGNNVSGVSSFIFQNWDQDSTELIDLEYLETFISENTVGSFVYSKTQGEGVRLIQYSEYGGTAPAFILWKDDIQSVIDSSASGDTVFVGSGTYDNISIDKSIGLLSASGKDSVTINGPGVSQGAALRIKAGTSGVVVGSGDRGFTFSAQSPDLAAVYLEEGVSGFIITGSILNGGTRNAFLTTGSTSDIIVTGNSISGDGPRALAYNNGETSLGASRASDNVKFTNNNFIGGINAGLLLGIEASDATISGNTFSGTSSYAQLELWGTGAAVSGNNFSSSGSGYAFADAASLYDESSIMDSNTGGVIISGSNNIYNTLQSALEEAVANDTVIVDGAVYSEGSTNIQDENLRIQISEGVSGLDSLILDSSVTRVSITGNDSSLVVLGNNKDNHFYISGENLTVNGFQGYNTVYVEGRRNEYSFLSIPDGYTFTDNRSGSPNGTNTITSIDQAGFDDITVLVLFGTPVNYPGSSISFQNDSSIFVIDDAGEFDLSSSVSIEFWIKVSGFSETDQAITKKGEDSWSIHRNGDSDQLSFTSYSSGVQHTLTGNISVNDNSWHHIAAVFDGVSKSLYVDGMLDISESADAFDTNNEDIKIGGWQGNIDELRIWNTGISQNQIRNDLFQQLKGDEENLAGYWKMDEGVGSLITDHSSSASNSNIPVNSGISWGVDNPPSGRFITGDEGWRILTSPSSNVSYGELLSGLWTQGFTGADSEEGEPNVFTYQEGDGNEDASLRGFTPISSADAKPDPGQAFIVYVYEDVAPSTAGVQGGFPKIIRSDSVQRYGEILPSLSLTKSGSEGTYDELNDGWNLIGNPYGSTIDWDRTHGWNRTGLDSTFYVWSDSANGGTGSYLSWNGLSGTLSDGKIQPLQGFWVKANNSETPALGLDDSSRYGGIELSKLKSIPEIRLRLSGKDMSNQALIMFSDNASTGKDKMDAFKLESYNSDWLALYSTVNGGSAMDIQALPIVFENELNVDIGIDGSELNGEHEISWDLNATPKDWFIYLFDSELGISTDMKAVGFYSFRVSSDAASKEKKSIKNPGQVHVLIPQSGSGSTKSKIKNERFRVVVTKNQIIKNEEPTVVPSKLSLEQNYPNPFNPTTTIEFSLPVDTKVQLKVFDLLGREVAALIDNELLKAGNHRATFFAKGLSSGIYYYRIETEGYTVVKQMTLVK